MSGLFGTPVAATQAQQNPAISGLSLQTSAYGKVIPLAFGANRFAPNLKGYWDFVAIPHVSVTGGGGGGKGGGGNDNGQVNVSYTYTAALTFALCEGPITGYGNVYANKALTTTAALGFTEFYGSYPQTPWSYLTTKHTSEAFGYNGIAYLAVSGYDLGASPSLPNHNVEVFGKRYATGNSKDADPSLVAFDLLSDTHFGVPNFSQYVGSLTSYQTYCFAAGLFVSPVYETQQNVSTMLDELALLTNSEVLYTASNKLTLIPRGDETITGNGKTYTPPGTIYNLTDDDFLPVSGGGGASSSVNTPILIVRKRPSDQINSVRLECCDRSNAYLKTPVEVKDQASIDAFGLRQQGVTQAHMICDLAIGQTSAQLQLQRQGVRNMYYFATDLRYLLLDAMDILTLTHAAQGLNRVGVRIRRIQKTGNTLQFEAEEYLAATGTAAAYSLQPGSGFTPNYLVAPGSINKPVLFEPTFDLSGAMEIWAAVSGANPTVWGGAEIWGSYDGTNYSLMTTINVASRMGTLTAQLPTIAGTAPLQDDSNTLSVNVSESAAQLVTVSFADELAGNALCYVDGEYISYRAAGLIGPGQYNLTHMLRGMYGTGPIMSGTTHQAGSDFVRLDGRIAKIPYDQTRIGATLYLKFLSFNIYGRATQSLSNVSPYIYTIHGLLAGSTTVQNFNVVAVNVSSDNGGYTPGLKCTWNAITNSAVTAVLIEFFAVAASTHITKEYANNPALGAYTIIQGLQPNTQYEVRATIITDPSLLPATYTNYVAVTTGSQLTTTPSTNATGIPTGLTGQAAIRTVFLAWTNPRIASGQIDPQLHHVEIWAGLSPDGSVASQVGTAQAEYFVHSGLLPNTTYYYFLRAVSTSGVKSAFTSVGVAVTTALINTPDIITGAVVADKIFAGAVTADKIAAGAVTADKIAANSITAGNAALTNLVVSTLKIDNNAVIVPSVVSNSNQVDNGTASIVNVNIIGVVVGQPITIEGTFCGAQTEVAHTFYRADMYIYDGNTGAPILVATSGGGSSCDTINITGAYTFTPTTSAVSTAIQVVYNGGGGRSMFGRILTLFAAKR